MLSFEMYFSFWFCEGNHETDNMNQMYGFEGEVKAKYTGQMFQLFSEVFQWLPLAQCINNKVLVRNKSDVRFSMYSAVGFIPLRIFVFEFKYKWNCVSGDAWRTV